MEEAAHAVTGKCFFFWGAAAPPD